MVAENGRIQNTVHLSTSVYVVVCLPVHFIHISASVSECLSISICIVVCLAAHLIILVCVVVYMSVKLSMSVWF